MAWPCCGGDGAGVAEQMMGQWSWGATWCWGSCRVLEGWPGQHHLANSKTVMIHIVSGF